MPFVDYDDRPISIDEGSREVRLPHETGISMMTRDHGGDWKRHRATKNLPIRSNVVFTHAVTCPVSVIPFRRAGRQDLPQEFVDTVPIRFFDILIVGMDVVIDTGLVGY